MFLDSLTGSNRKELEATCDELAKSLKQKQEELENREKQIERLSKNIRKWTRKYNELELSISETVIDTLDPTVADNSDETKHLQLMLVKLNRRNAKLEKRLNKMAELLENVSAHEAEIPKSSDAILGADSDAEPEFSPEFKQVLNHFANAAAT